MIDLFVVLQPILDLERSKLIFLMWILAIRWSFIFTHYRLHYRVEILDARSPSSTVTGGLGPISPVEEEWESWRCFTNSIKYRLTSDRLRPQPSLPSTTRKRHEDCVVTEHRAAPQSSFIQLTP